MGITDQAFSSAFLHFAAQFACWGQPEQLAEGCKNLSKLPLDGQPVLVAFVVIIILPILSMLKDAGHFRARHFGKRARYRFGRVSLDRVLSLFRSHLVLFVESQV